MPNHKAAEKSLRQNVKRRERNIAAKSRLRTLTKKVRQSVTENNSTTAEENLRAIISSLDTAAKKHVIHPRNAARKKSRLTRLVNSLKDTV
ncbi:MAG: 30S ribosomal protein S20 [Candidatus Omnitrophota bacterium]|jgi:small subunit ribosomal protein S20|nr:MAG: 30S ribosomal protein S20 [Candidatus Omnitrophota bacterium]